MSGLSLIIPMAGRGSRFSKRGNPVPKPLIDLHGRPFFWWAIESVVRAFPIKQIIVVVLEEHEINHGITREVHRWYPDAHVIVLPEVTSGAAETAAHGVRALVGDGPFAVNDCDHAFDLSDGAGILQRLAETASGYLVGFRSDRPNFSFVRLSDDGERVIGTVEKQAVSPFAIAGCYFFASRQSFEIAYEKFRNDCPYDELFMSGLYNLMCAAGDTVLFQELANHIPFGTPDEQEQVTASRLSSLGIEIDGR